jgi:hypothetical protein
VFTARYALSPYIKQIRSVFKGLIDIRTAITCNRSVLILRNPRPARLCSDIKTSTELRRLNNKLVYATVEWEEERINTVQLLTESDRSNETPV